MLKQTFIDDLTQHLTTLLASSPAKDVERNARALLTSQLARLDLVSREEFDIQARLLQGCLARLEQLEARVSELERGDADVSRVSPH